MGEGEVRVGEGVGDGIRVRDRAASTFVIQIGDSIQITSGHILEGHALVLIVDLDGDGRVQ